MKEFKDILYELRSSRGISQAQLAHDLKLSVGLVGLYETGKRMPSRTTQEQLADYFNVTLDYLMGRDDHSIYYLTPETAQIAQRVFDDPNLKVLFDAANGASPEDIKLAAEMLKRLKETNPDG